MGTNGGEDSEAEAKASSTPPLNRCGSEGKATKVTMLCAAMDMAAACGASDRSWPPTRCGAMAMWLTQSIATGWHELRHGTRDGCATCQHGSREGGGGLVACCLARDTRRWVGRGWVKKEGNRVGRAIREGNKKEKKEGKEEEKNVKMAWFRPNLKLVIFM